MPGNDLPLPLKQSFPPIIWTFTEGEGDKIESRLPFKIFSTLQLGIFFRSTCSILEKNWRHQKYISKLTDL